MAMATSRRERRGGSFGKLSATNFGNQFDTLIATIRRYNAAWIECRVLGINACGQCGTGAGSGSAGVSFGLDGGSVWFRRRQPVGLAGGQNRKDPRWHGDYADDRARACNDGNDGGHG